MKLELFKWYFFNDQKYIIFTHTENLVIYGIEWSSAPHGTFFASQFREILVHVDKYIDMSRPKLKGPEDKRANKEVIKKVFE